MTKYKEVLNQLEYLKLRSARDWLINEHMENPMTLAELEGISRLLSVEMAAKEITTQLYNVKVAGFPFLKKISDYDFDFQPSLKKERILEIEQTKFYENATNVVFIGNPGVGKTHLAVGLGYSVAIQRTNVYFIKFNKLINQLRLAYHEGTFEKKLKLFFKYRLLIIDEVGFSEITQLEAKLFFQLIDLRYEKKSTIFTSNLLFEKWVTVFGNDEMITKAILDRILHHSYLFNITGPSYRIKDKFKLNKNRES